MWYYLLLIYQLRSEEALHQIEMAEELDPLSPVINFNHGFFYSIKREYAKGLEICKRITELDPTYDSAYWGMAWIYGKMKKFYDMEHNFETWVQLNQGSFPLVRKNAETFSGYLRGDRETVKRLLPELEDHFQETLTNVCDIAGLYFYLGEIDKGFDWLERSYSKRDWHLLWIKCLETFDEVRSDRRYVDLVKRLGLDHTEAELAGR